ncbi:hypothetical protein G9A89_022798 [Geosiphon pyriformis]|nr:hypothetical protein G9A89_022798 [Geosiphon pyriformis]
MVLKTIIYGGSGSLGTGVVALFLKHGWEVVSVGTRPHPQATYNVVVPLELSLQEQGEKVSKAVKEILELDEKFDAIISVAGGFAMGNVGHKDFLKNSDLMLRKSVWPSLISSQLAVLYLKEGGILTVTGVAGLRATPAFIGYGVAKAGVHQLVYSLAAPGSGLPKNVKVAGLLPKTIDTPIARESTPNADFSKYTPINDLAQHLYDWATGAIPIPHGKLVEAETENNKTLFKEVNG